jgi:hypothetical protein
MKAIFKLLLFLVILAIAAIAGVTYYLDSIAKTAVEYGGSEALGVPTTVNKLHISLIDGKSSLSDFVIANPKGFSAQNFMQLKQGNIAIDMQSITSDTIHIAEISLSGLHLNLEQNSQASNVKALMTKLPQSKNKKSASTAPKNSPKKSTPAQSNGKKFVVDRITLSDIGVTAKLQALGTQLSDVSLNIPQIDLADIGKAQGGMTMPELIQYVINQVLDAVAKNSSNLSPALAAMLKGDLASVDGLKAGAKQFANAEVDKAATKLLQKINLPAGENAELQQTANKLVNDLFNSK